MNGNDYSRIFFKMRCSWLTRQKNWINCEMTLFIQIITALINVLKTKTFTILYMNHLFRLIVWVCNILKVSFLCFLFFWTYLLWNWIIRIVIVNICHVHFPIMYRIFSITFHNCFQMFSLFFIIMNVDHICPQHA